VSKPPVNRSAMAGGGAAHGQAARSLHASQRPNVVNQKERDDYERQVTKPKQFDVCLYG